MNLRKNTLHFVRLSILCIFLIACVPRGESKPVSSLDKRSKIVELFIQLFSPKNTERAEALARIEHNWREDYAVMLVETITIHPDPIYRHKLLKLLEAKTQQDFGYDINAWFEWIWSKDGLAVEDYADFKAYLYGLIDFKFRNYFSKERTTKIRLDEVRWGGVKQDGIPPLRNPKMLKADEATYLQGNHVIFGLVVNGQARAYPKRILAWHEMFTDEIAGVPVVGVYCTLCGSMILYKSTTQDGAKHQMGTSGFLYRSNKLMYDQATQSLWNTILGEPVIGPLADQDISLETMSVVTTTWEEWKKRHPDTQVLSLDTGHERDYSEGAAYREYFATDALMFNVPVLDKRLKNKQEVLSLYFPAYPDYPLAISAKFLKKHSVYEDQIGEKSLVVLTDASGANRVYERKGLHFKSWDQEKKVLDTSGRIWTLSEEALRSEDGQVLQRLPSHRAFWFGWYSMHPKTRLIK